MPGQPISHFSALIFDCDGTLARTAPLHFRSMAEALQQQGFSMPQGWYDTRIGLSRQDLFQEFENSFSVSIDVPAACQHSRETYAALARLAQPIQPVLDIAIRYSGTIPMAVASGGERDLVDATLTAIGAANLFDQTITISDVARGKPAPDLFLKAAQRLRVPPQGCLVFEDSKEGLEAARRALMQAVDVRFELRIGIRPDSL